MRTCRYNCLSFLSVFRLSLCFNKVYRPIAFLLCTVLQLCFYEFVARCSQSNLIVLHSSVLFINLSVRFSKLLAYFGHNRLWLQLPNIGRCQWHWLVVESCFADRVVKLLRFLAWCTNCVIYTEIILQWRLLIFDSTVLRWHAFWQGVKFNNRWARLSISLYLNLFLLFID